jgi:hypothetical protein
MCSRNAGVLNVKLVTQATTCLGNVGNRLAEGLRYVGATTIIGRGGIRVEFGDNA